MKNYNKNMVAILAGVSIVMSMQTTVELQALEVNENQNEIQKNIEANILYDSNYTKSNVVLVSNADQLSSALRDENINIVNITNDIELSHGLYVDGTEKEIRGNGNTLKGIKYPDSQYDTVPHIEAYTDLTIDNLKLEGVRLFSGDNTNLNITNNSEINNHIVEIYGNATLKNIKMNNISIFSSSGGRKKELNIIDTEIYGNKNSRSVLDIEGGSTELENVKITTEGNHAIYAEGFEGDIRIKGLLEIDGPKKDAIVLKKGYSKANPLELYIDGDIKQIGDTYTVKAEEEGTYTKVHYDENNINRVIEKWSNAYYSTKNREGNEPDSIVYFNDIKNHWAEDAIEIFVNEGYIDGYGDNSFRPDDSMTRAEFVKVVNKVFGFKISGLESFKDVNETDWYYSDICIALKAGYIKGKSSDLFAPNDEITRQEVAMILTNINNNKDTNLDKLNGFKDGNNTDDWAMSSVEGAIEAGYIGGYHDGTIKPKGNITRSEAISMLSRVKK